MAAQTFDTRIGRQFAAILKARQDVITQSVMNGAYDEQMYAREVGRFKGLEEALELYEEAEAMVKAAERS